MMTDRSTSSRMRRQRERDTACELALRSELHRRGLRYRVDRPLPFDRRRRADITFITRRLVVFVDGCFWHGCPVHGSWPRRNREWWLKKLHRNRCRDAESDARLRADGWIVVRVWEHEDAVRAADCVERLLRRA